MEVYTTEPGLQMYTGNFLAGISRTVWCNIPRRSAVCFEAQKFQTLQITPISQLQIVQTENIPRETIYKFGIDK